MNAIEFCHIIIERYPTRDPFRIAERAGVRIIYESWFPATIGEFDKKRRTICVNMRAGEAFEKIVAHELGHFFAAELGFDKATEEKFCREFAESLTEKL